MNAYPFHAETSADLAEDLPEHPNRFGSNQTALPNRATEAIRQPAVETRDSGPALPSGELLARRITALREALHPLFKMQSLAEWKRGLVALFMELQWFTGFAHAQHYGALAQLGAS